MKHPERLKKGVAHKLELVVTDYWAVAITENGNKFAVSYCFVLANETKEEYEF